MWGEYRVTRPAGTGGYSEVYQAKSLLNGKRIAVKIEKNHTENGQALRHEAAILTKLAGVEGIPKVTFVKKSGGRTVLGLQLLGKSLYSLRKAKAFLPTPENQVLLAWHLLALIESVHQKNVLHLDFKPDNILMSRGKHSRLYLIDFGLSVDTQLPHPKSHSALGNPLFCSSRRMENRLATRRDDLESWLYTLVFLTNLRLPWDSEAKHRNCGWIDTIKEMKDTISAELLCKDLPLEFVAITHHIRSIRCMDRPNYAYLRSLLIEAAKHLHLDLSSPLQITQEDKPSVEVSPFSNSHSQSLSIRAASCMESLHDTSFCITNSRKSTMDEMETEKDITAKCAPVLTESVKNYLKDAEQRVKRRGSACE